MALRCALTRLRFAADTKEPLDVDRMRTMFDDLAARTLKEGPSRSRAAGVNREVRQAAPDAVSSGDRAEAES
ncbi:hypothetical protein [Burkholderia multivorans]|uniref:Uncharacterized protein n=1 Tax=Burkholderia multivorans TaxID=87883 RepID=A0AB37APW3_9BURK|nr:hypothetical protein [Burkholderia multivorans]MBU9589644.1 hypothetical protein [Burkholderia multivorans]PRE39283.1 hypothetical protein C6P97_30800 [Burkholderia multivorans]PRE42295.1 hypothetical protein C6P99_24805 [Burkholderia multivorans]